MDERLQQFETKMEKTCEYLEADFMTIRAGRANPHVLDKSVWITTVLPRRCSRWAM